jgi:cell wall-associated NlpC family hydrolase
VSEAWFNDERSAALEGVARSWVGTPFMPNAAIKGAGVSCQKLAAAIYAEVGFVAVDCSVPDGPMDWGGAHKAGESLIVKYLEGLVAEGKLGVVGNVSAGDLLGFQIGGCVQHLGVALRDDRFVHCWRGSGVIISRRSDATFATRLRRAWRPMQGPESKVGGDLRLEIGDFKGRGS